MRERVTVNERESGLDAEYVLEEMPPSAKLVYKVLEYEGSMSQKEVSEVSRLPRRTTRKALKELTEKGLVDSSLCLEDGRKKIYSINMTEESSIRDYHDTKSTDEENAD